MEKSEILKLVGKRIKELRESKGISQVEVVGKMSSEMILLISPELNQEEPIPQYLPYSELRKH